MSIDDKGNTFNVNQEIRISDRAGLTVTGVEDVESFDDVSIILKSNLGMIAIDGEELHICSLSRETGLLSVEGKIGGVVFFEPRTGTGGKARSGEGQKGNGAGSKKSRGFFR